MIPGVGRRSLFVVKALKLLTTAKKKKTVYNKETDGGKIYPKIAALKNRFSKRQLR